ncbi:MAG: hypothetical protein ABEJ43_03560 [Haloferacaceae archaeon]
MSSGGVSQTVQEERTTDQAGEGPEPVVESDASGPLTRDDLFEALDNRRRRYTIHYLQERGDDAPVDLSDVSTQVAAWELEEDPDQIGYSDRKNVHTALYQFHAPKLDDLGLVEYNKRRGAIELTAHGERLGVDINCDEPDQERSRHVPAALGGCLAALALATWLAVPAAWPAVLLPLVVASAVGFGAGAWYTDSQSGAQTVVEEHLPTTVTDD